MQIKNIGINIVEIVSVFMLVQIIRALAAFEPTTGTEPTEVLVIFMILYAAIETIKFIANHKFIYIKEGKNANTTTD